MPELRNNGDDQPKSLASHPDDLAAQADVALARYPPAIREQITDLLRVLAEKSGKAETKFDSDLPK